MPAFLLFLFDANMILTGDIKNKYIHFVLFDKVKN